MSPFFLEKLWRMNYKYYSLTNCIICRILFSALLLLLSCLINADCPPDTVVIQSNISIGTASCDAAGILTETHEDCGTACGDKERDGITVSGWTVRTFSSANCLGSICGSEPCSFGSVQEGCAVECPGNAFHSAGKVGNGQSCPFDFGYDGDGDPLLDDDSKPEDYGCITSGEISACDPGSDFGSDDNLIPDLGLLPPRDLESDSSSGSGSGSGGGGGGGENGNSASGSSLGDFPDLTSDNAQNFPLYDFCQFNRDDPLCSGFTSRDIIPESEIQCSHGGWRSDVIGCDFIPADCDSGTSYDSDLQICRSSRDSDIFLPGYLPSFQDGQVSSSSSTSSSSTSSSSTSSSSGSAISGDVNVDVDVDIDTSGIESRLDSINSRLSGSCSPFDSAYITCITDRTIIFQVSNVPNASLIVSDSMASIMSSPIMQIGESLKSSIPTGGQCEPLRIDLTMMNMGIVTDELYCDFSDSAGSLLGAVMLMLYAFMSFRIVMSA